MILLTDLPIVDCSVVHRLVSNAETCWVGSVMLMRQISDNFVAQMSLLELGHTFTFQGNFEEAENVLIAAIRFPFERSTYAAQMYLAGLYLTKLHEPMNALTHYNHCYEQNPLNTDVHLPLAKLLTEACHDHVRAMSVLQQAIRLNSHEKEYYFLLGQIYEFRFSDYDNAHVCYTQTLARWPLNAEFNMAYLRNKALHFDWDINKVQACLSAMQEDDLSASSHFSHVGKSNYVSGLSPTEDALMRQVLSHTPDCSVLLESQFLTKTDAHLYRARFFEFIAGNDESAITHYRTALRHDRSNDVAQFELARCLAKVKVLQTEAIDILHNCLAADPAFGECKVIMSRLIDDDERTSSSL